MQIHATQFRGRPGPARAIEISAKFEWMRDPAFLLSVSATAKLADRIISDRVSFEKGFWGNSYSGNNMLMLRDGNHQGTLIVPVSAEAINYIEENRREQDVSLNVSCIFAYQEAVEVPGQDGKKRYVAGQVYSESASVYDCVIKRSDWLKRLGEMAWEDYEIFEVSKLDLVKDKNLSVAFQRLVDAQTALRSGDYHGVLAKCRMAFESAAKYESEGDTKKGFESLLSRAFERDQAKQDTTNSVIKSLSDYAHLLGRHEQYPALSVSREEAEFCFCAVVSTFSLISRLLAKARKKNT